MPLKADINTYIYIYKKQKTSRYIWSKLSCPRKFTYQPRWKFLFLKWSRKKKRHLLERWPPSSHSFPQFRAWTKLSCIWENTLVGSELCPPWAHRNEAGIQPLHDNFSPTSSVKRSVASLAKKRKVRYPVVPLSPTYFILLFNFILYFHYGRVSFGYTIRSAIEL